jgi:hypothetical protein
MNAMIAALLSDRNDSYQTISVRRDLGRAAPAGRRLDATPHNQGP